MKGAIVFEANARPIKPTAKLGCTSPLFGLPNEGESEAAWQGRRYLMGTALFCGVVSSIAAVVLNSVRHSFTFGTIPTIVLALVGFGFFFFIRLSNRVHSPRLSAFCCLVVLAYTMFFCSNSTRAPLFPLIATNAIIFMSVNAMATSVGIVAAAVVQLLWSVFLFIDIHEVVNVGFLDLEIAPSTSLAQRLAIEIGFGVVIQLLSLFLFANYLRKVLEQERQLENTVSVAHAISTAIAQYDTAGAMAALEDHGEYIDPDLQSAFVDIVKNLGEYRAFLPPALLSKHRALGHVMRTQSFSTKPSGTPSEASSDDYGSPWAAATTELSSPKARVNDSPRQEGALIDVIRSSSMHSSFASIDGANASEIVVADVQHPFTHTTRSETPNTRASRLGRGTRTATHAPMSSFQNPFHRFPQAVVGFVEFSRVTLMDQAEAGPALSAGFATLARLCREHDATLQGCTGDTALLTWGVDRERPSDVAEAVCRFAIALRSAFAQSADRTPSMALAGAPCDVSCAISSGLALCGAVGHDTAKHFSVLGPCSPGQAPGAALLLQLEGAKFHNAITVSPDLAELAHGLFHLRMIDIVGSASTSTSTAAVAAVHHAFLGKPVTSAECEDKTLLYEVVAPVDLSSTTDGGNTAATEWMYNLQHQAASSSPFGVCDVMNSAVEKLAMGHYDEAAAVLDTLSNQQRLDPRVATLERSAAAWHSSQSRHHQQGGHCPMDSSSNLSTPLHEDLGYCRQFFK